MQSSLHQVPDRDSGMCHQLDKTARRLGMMLIVTKKILRAANEKDLIKVGINEILSPAVIVCSEHLSLQGRLHCT